MQCIGIICGYLLIGIEPQPMKDVPMSQRNKGRRGHGTGYIKMEPNDDIYAIVLLFQFVIISCHCFVQIL